MGSFLPVLLIVSIVSLVGVRFIPRTGRTRHLWLAFCLLNLAVAGYLAHRTYKSSKAFTALEERTRDRMVSPALAKAMTDTLAPIAKGKVIVAAFQSDREAVDFGEDIAEMLQEAGCDAKFSATPAMNATYTGLVLLVKDPSRRPVFADAILSVFKSFSIQADGWLFHKDYDDMTLGIYVFPKPAPKDK